ncbi:hypothetical protein QA642_13300 [Bradyrhizobium sp. CB2312]|nr:hypothetical protein [Bradyrhizobium sp. CB2312]WFU76937.1 hypothetical protein QA642_13300 [Bradyrhizobium sp. CB2312]
MSDRRAPTAVEREAPKVFRDSGASVPASQYERDQQTFHANRERLKAERLACEAAVKHKPKTGSLRPQRG